MRFAGFVLTVFGAIQSAFGDSLVLMNRTGGDLVNLEIKFENSSGAHSVEKIDKLAARSKRKVSVSYQGIPAGDGSFSLSFSWQGPPYSSQSKQYSMRFGYGPSVGSTNVLIGNTFRVMKPGRSEPAEKVSTGPDLVLVTWID